MGVCGCTQIESVDMTLKDLPPPDTSGVKDRYRLFELGTVFARTPFPGFYEAVKEAANGENFVTFSSLADKL